ncbi:hypothetical protein CBS470a_008049 [Colletotrichum nupharicola]|nr:hypothetical protein CBS470a_008049 [Colletotrichum nupharicola]
MIFLDFKSVALMLLPVALASQSDVWTRATSGGCEAYSVQAGDTCSIIARSVNATYAQIISWNSEIDLTCSNLAELEGGNICVSNPLGNYALPSNSQGVPTIVTTAAPIPAPTPDKTNDNCGEYHLVQPGEDCSVFTTKFTITLKDFLFLNPQVWENCTNVWADYYYCVRPVGYISTYPGYLPPTTTKEFIQTPTTDLPFVEDAFANYTSTRPVIEVANGTRLDCYDSDIDPRAAQSPCSWRDSRLHSVVRRRIRYLVRRGLNSLTIAQFFAFNPSVKSDCSGMVIGTYYCTSTEPDGSPPLEDDDGQTTPSTTTGTSSTTGIATPSPVQSDMVSNCNKFYKVVSGDGCWAIADTNGIPLEDFYSWNPAVKTDCTGLQADVYVCVGVSASQTLPPATTTTTAAGGSPVTPTPTQEGMVGGCYIFYKVASGDGCWAIADAHGIALDDFYSWNPAVKTDCTGLQADVYVCVGLAAAGAPQPTSSTTADASAGATPSPVQEGMVTNCVKFHLVQSGDGCWAISDAQGIALNDFYTWNPAVKTDCSGLQADVYVCVGVA